tara:strand:+ start:94 stop:372 length:279 start_codon:yes stop_codon:yes gene_type:complete
MADAGGMHRDRPTVLAVGDYNRATYVNSSTTFHATGSNAGAGFIIENATNVSISLPNGGTIAGDALNVKELYPIGVKKIVIGGTGKAYILHK